MVPEAISSMMDTENPPPPGTRVDFGAWSFQWLGLHDESMDRPACDKPLMLFLRVGHSCALVVWLIGVSGACWWINLSSLNPNCNVLSLCVDPELVCSHFLPKRAKNRLNGLLGRRFRRWTGGALLVDDKPRHIRQCGEHGSFLAQNWQVVY